MGPRAPFCLPDPLPTTHGPRAYRGGPVRSGREVGPLVSLRDPVAEVRRVETGLVESPFPPSTQDTLDWGSGRRRDRGGGGPGAGADPGRGRIDRNPSPTRRVGVPETSRQRRMVSGEEGEKGPFEVEQEVRQRSPCSRRVGIYSKGSRVLDLPSLGL